ncbi:glycoside hydrolase family 44 protein [Rhodoblastus sp.]|uniref:glycoside hydrolase family 44 protein n=1 Tax=Rhodoblastus sp. TaxID=1962975 RepID=UPI0035ADD030
MGAIGWDASAETPLTVRIDDTAVGVPISPFIYGANEIGTMDGGAPSVDFDRKAGVTQRRLGGNLMTPYNWLNNATNAGKDYLHANGAFLLETLGVPKAQWSAPGAVVEAFLANSAGVGARSLLTLPLAGFVAADFDGEVPEAQTAPSSRFLPIDWSGRGESGKVSIPALLDRLIARHGRADSGGVLGYYLDNEPGLWPETHPRIVRKPVTIHALIERSLQAAKAIKAADPSALVLGPASWGATEYVNFVKAPDWDDYKSYGSFLAAYLDAFRRESGRAGLRLLDALDLHYYPFSRRGDLFRTENAGLSAALLDAPRSFDDDGFCEDSWVADMLGCRPRKGLFLPLLPSLKKIVDDNYPGTDLSFGEFNFGGAGLVASGLAVADVLGRFGRFGVRFANHWGSLAGFIGEAYRLYRAPDASGAIFGDTALPVAGGTAALSLFAGRDEKSGRVGLVAINKSEKPALVALSIASGRAPAVRAASGFDAANHAVAPVVAPTQAEGGAVRLALPARAARRFSLA